jgi:mannose-6-phosphate isomerase-like protein (cupin superfamily)
MQKQQVSAPRAPFVVPRGEIPGSNPGASRDAEIRPFLGHPGLAAALASASATLSWFTAQPGQEVGVQRQAAAGLLIIVRGSAQLVGTTRRAVEQGDVLTLPEGHEYGFSEVGPRGLEALQVLVRKAPDRTAEKEITLADVLTRNEARAQRILETRYFLMARDGTFASSQARTRFRQCARVFSDAFQILLFSRQALCRDSDYASIFHEHMTEEFGHNKMLTCPEDARIQQDPALQATTNWFTYQMLVLDNVGKAVINLVLETGGYHFLNMAKPVFVGDAAEEYFRVHAEADEQHKDLGAELFEGQHPLTYRSMLRLVDQCWDMLETLTDRIYELIHLQEASA